MKTHSKIHPPQSAANPGIPEPGAEETAGQGEKDPGYREEPDQPAELGIRQVKPLDEERRDRPHGLELKAHGGAGEGEHGEGDPSIGPRPSRRIHAGIVAEPRTLPSACSGRRRPWRRTPEHGGEDTSVYDGQSRRDQRHARDVARLDVLAEEGDAEQHGVDGHEQRDEEEIARDVARMRK